jgi:Tol biopolymer transport system component
MSISLRFVPGPIRAALAASLLGAAASAQATIRASVDSSGAAGNDQSRNPSLSADGRIVAFYSFASNLVPGDTNGKADTFVHDRSTGITERVSVSSSGAQGDGDSFTFVYAPALSADGRFVAFTSNATNLVAGDTNGKPDVFVRDRVAGTTERVSVGSSGQQGDWNSVLPSLSSDGRYVAFLSLATNLVAGDSNGAFDVFVRDRVAATTERVSVDSSGVEANDGSGVASLSADGRIVAFESFATNLVAGDTNGIRDVFVRDRVARTTARVSVGALGVEGNDESFDPALSADGRIVAFESFATNLVAGDANGYGDVFVHDLAGGITERVSVGSSGQEGVSESYLPAISGDGNLVAFASWSWNLVAGDTNGFDDVFVHDRTTGATTRANVDSYGAQSATAVGEAPAISADGSTVAFFCGDSNLVPGDANGVSDVFLRAERVDATWSNYGAGFAGANGVPTFTSRADPVLGTTVTLDLGSSSKAASVAYVLIGYAEAFVPTRKGGDLLVEPSLTLVVPLPSAGTTIVADLEDDAALVGLRVYAQALEFDPGAAKGISFTPGLKLILGR